MLVIITSFFSPDFPRSPVHMHGLILFILQARCFLPNFQKYHDILKTFLTEFHLINHKHNSGYEAEVSTFFKVILQIKLFHII